MNQQSEIIQYLNALFPHFELALREKLSDHCTIKQFSKGELLMQTGQYFRSTMLIVDGTVKLYREGDDGNEYFMYYIGAGEACALSLICAGRQQASEVMARAVEDTTALLVPIDLMDNLIKDYKTWYYFVIDTYRKRYEELLTVIDHIAFKSMDERLEFYLKQQYGRMKTRNLSITHQQIASDLNSSREVISRLLKKMEQRGDLILHRSYIEWKK
jgi:CRP/FNR family transcriptional regulator